MLWHAKGVGPGPPHHGPLQKADYASAFFFFFFTFIFISSERRRSFGPVIDGPTSSRRRFFRWWSDAYSREFVTFVRAVRLVIVYTGLLDPFGVLIFSLSFLFAHVCGAGGRRRGRKGGYFFWSWQGRTIGDVLRVFPFTNGSVIYCGVVWPPLRHRAYRMFVGSRWDIQQ